MREVKLFFVLKKGKPHGLIKNGEKDEVKKAQKNAKRNNNNFSTLERQAREVKPSQVLNRLKIEVISSPTNSLSVRPQRDKHGEWSRRTMKPSQENETGHKGE